MLLVLASKSLTKDAGNLAKIGPLAFFCVAFQSEMYSHYKRFLVRFAQCVPPFPSCSWTVWCVLGAVPRLPFPMHHKPPSVHDSARRVPCKETRGVELRAKALWYVACRMLGYQTHTGLYTLCAQSCARFLKAHCVCFVWQQTCRVRSKLVLGVAQLTVLCLALHRLSP